MSSGLVAKGPTEFSARQNTACRFCENPWRERERERGGEGGREGGKGGQKTCHITALQLYREGAIFYNFTPYK